MIHQFPALPEDHVPRLSPDSTLTALAQLATYRLAVGRAMISLIDNNRQYILAEATPKLSLRAEAPGDASKNMLLGSVSIPRNCGMCEKVLDLNLTAFTLNEYPALVIKDLEADREHTGRALMTANMRFYAGVPLLSPSGAIVGSLCVLDETPRPDGLSMEHQSSLRDVAESIMEYLNNYTIRDKYQRGENFTRGLISFSEGASTLIPFEDENQRDSETSVKINSTVADPAASWEEEEEESEPKNILAPSMLPAQPTVRFKSGRQRSLKKLQENILPMDSTSMFQRAANVIMQSSKLDGVVILDASVAANRSHKHHSGQDGSTDTETAGSYMTNISSSDETGSPPVDLAREPTPKLCQVLGSAAPSRPNQAMSEAHPPFGSLQERASSSNLQAVSEMNTNFVCLSQETSRAC